MSTYQTGQLNTKHSREQNIIQINTPNCIMFDFSHKFRPNPPKTINPLLSIAQQSLPIARATQNCLPAVLFIVEPIKLQKNAHTIRQESVHARTNPTEKAVIGKKRAALLVTLCSLALAGCRSISYPRAARVPRKIRLRESAALARACP